MIAFKIKEFALPLIGFGMLFAVSGGAKRQKFIGNSIVGFGLLFVGMQTMENAMSFLRDRQDIFLAFQQSPLLGVLAGNGPYNAGPVQLGHGRSHHRHGFPGASDH
jgi:phosphate:Na+ symporter